MSDAAEEATEGPTTWERVRVIGRWLLLLIGIGAVVGLVMDAGADAVWSTLLAAGVFLPLVMIGEVGFIGMDVLSLRLMFGPRAKGVPALVWLRTAMMAYGIMILLPAGRAGGEVARAAGLAPYVGGARAAAGATVLQGVTMMGNTLVTIPCWVAVAMTSGPGSALAWLVLGNGLITGVVGSVIIWGARNSRVGHWLTARLDRIAKWLSGYTRLGTIVRWRIRRWNRHGNHYDESLREMKTPWLPIGAAFLGRLSQSAQYGVIVIAVGGALTVGWALVAQSIHLVGAGLGDMVPNQAGVTEGAYRIFAGYLPALTVAQAIAIALVHRVCQFFMAGVSLAVCALWKPEELNGDAGGSVEHGSQEPA